MNTEEKKKYLFSKPIGLEVSPSNPRRYSKLMRPSKYLEVLRRGPSSCAKRPCSRLTATRQDWWRGCPFKLHCCLLWIEYGRRGHGTSITPTTNITQAVSSRRIAYPGISNRSARQGPREIPNRGHGQPPIAGGNTRRATAGHGYTSLPCILTRRTSHGVPAGQSRKKICHIAFRCW